MDGTNIFGTIAWVTSHLLILLVCICILVHYVRRARGK
jgi:hypothetical protein